MAGSASGERTGLAALDGASRDGDTLPTLSDSRDPMVLKLVRNEHGRDPELDGQAQSFVESHGGIPSLVVQGVRIQSQTRGGLAEHGFVIISRLHSSAFLLEKRPLDAKDQQPSDDAIHEIATARPKLVEVDVPCSKGVTRLRTSP